LSVLRIKGKLFNSVKQTGYWDVYKSTPTCYNNAIRNRSQNKPRGSTILADSAHS